MKALETLIPPPIVTVIIMILMYWVPRSILASSIQSNLLFFVAIATGLAAIMIMLAGIAAFAKDRTTLNPMRIDQASTLVTSGIFKFTRNPMYLGDVIFLFAWCLLLATPWAIFGPFLLMIYLTQFQIKPEERMMQQKFGTAYKAYQSQVRRWI